MGREGKHCTRLEEIKWKDAGAKLGREKKKILTGVVPGGIYLGPPRGTEVHTALTSNTEKEKSQTIPMGEKNRQQRGSSKEAEKRNHPIPSSM